MNPCHKTKSWYHKPYRDYILSQQPLIEGGGQTVPHHVRIDNNAGIGMKPSDFYCVPLSQSIHCEFHAGKESDREFFERHNIDIYRVMFRLYTYFMTDKNGG